MNNTEYTAFRKRINPIIKACTVPLDSKAAVYFGASSFTQSSKYPFLEETAYKYRDELISICRDLPKLNDVIPGTACSISALQLITQTTNTSILKLQMEAAEKFMYLMNLIEVAGVRSVTNKQGITYAIMDIAFMYKDAVCP